MSKKINKSVSDNPEILKFPENIKLWITRNILNQLNNPDTSKLRKNWFKKTHNLYAYELILYKTYFLSEESKFSERLYCILNNIQRFKKCKTCNNKVKYLDFNRGYRQYCSFKCSNKSKEKKEKIEKTMIAKYGYKNSMQVPIIKEKARKTCLNKYGTEICSRNNDVKNKMKQTCLEKYNTNCSLNYIPIQEKRTQTWKKKYINGHPSSSNEVKKKTKQTCMKKYGVPHPSQRHINKDILFNCFNNPSWLTKEHHIEKKTCASIAKENNVDQKLIINRLKKFNIKQIFYPNSTFEQDIISYISDSNIQNNTRDVIPPYELDIYIPNNNLAIEFNGIYWHSNIDKNYHINKTKMCENKDIQLLHIFENEWVNETTRDIWKSIINEKLGRNDKMFAKKTEIREITDNKIIEKFLNDNHLQGHCKSSVKLGLFYENELISLMTFNKTRFVKKNEWEIIRFCNKKFINIIDGASKLYKHFINNYNPNSIISYANRRYNNGNLYKKLGMKFSHNSDPNCWYFKNGTYNLYNKAEFQKHKLSSKLKIFNNNQSESENIIDNEFRKIWDCGNSIYTI